MNHGTPFYPPDSPDSLPPISRRRPGVLRWGFRLLAACIACAGVYAWWTYHGPRAPIEIYRGVTYSCERMPDGPESGGLMYLIRADLKVPGVGIYMTPLDPDAVNHGWEYQLKYVSTVVKQNHLAAAVNGTRFESNSSFIRMPGDWARGIETVVADHQVSHLYQHTYLMWWDDLMNGHLEITKPPTPALLAKAKWGIGAQAPILIGGKINSWAGHKTDHRTMIAVDGPNHIVWLAVFDKASDAFACKILAEHGAKFGATVDGGTSSAMAIGPDAHGVQGGTVMGNWRPVATQFGIRALPR